MLGNILLGIVSICTFISYFPQTIKLIKTKKSNDLSIQSWILWVTSSLAYTIYAVEERNVIKDGIKVAGFIKKPFSDY